MPLSLDNIVKVRSNISSLVATQAKFGRTLMLFDASLTTNPLYKATGNTLVNEFFTYDDIAENNDWKGSDIALNAAKIYFAQKPYPEKITFATLQLNPIDASITSGANTVLATLKAATGNKLILNINGLDVTCGSFSGAADSAAIATIIETALNNAFNDVAWTVTATGLKYTISTKSKVREGQVIPITIPDIKAGYLNDLLKIESADNPVTNSGTNGFASFDSQLNDIFSRFSDYYFVCHDKGVSESNRTKLATWCAANNRLCFLEYGKEAALVANETTSLLAIESAKESSNTVGFYSGAGTTLQESFKYIGLATAAVLSGTNYTGLNTYSTLKFTSLENITAEDITLAQKQELDRKRVNYYAKYANQSFVAEGVTFDPEYYADTKIWLDWLTQRMETDISNGLVNAVPKISQNNLGISRIKALAESVCDIASRNGLISPGTISESIANSIRIATGNSNFDGYLTRGYLVYVPPINATPQNDLANRKTTVYIWLKGSGQIHNLDIDMTLIA